MSAIRSTRALLPSQIRHGLKSWWGRQSLLLQKGVCASKAGEHTEQEVCSVFISNASLPLTLMGGFGFTIFATVYLEKGAHEVRGTLKQGEQEHSFG
jgi:hypothetical protein